MSPPSEQISLVLKNRNQGGGHKMNKYQITVLCNICKRPSDTDNALCSDCIVAISLPSLSYQAQQEEITAHSKHIIMMAHEVLKYDSILLKD